MRIAADAVTTLDHGSGWAIVRKMKPCLMLILSVAALGFRGIPPVQGQGSPGIVWEAVTPSAIANSIQGVGWSTDASGPVSFGSTDRWMRTRQADNGSLLYSVLQPI